MTNMLIVTTDARYIYQQYDAPTSAHVIAEAMRFVERNRREQPSRLFLSLSRSQPLMEFRVIDEPGRVLGLEEVK